MIGSLCPSSLKRTPRHGTRFSSKALDWALSLSTTSDRAGVPRRGSRQGPRRTDSGPTFTLTCILTATGAEATTDSSGTRTPHQSRFLQDSVDPDSHARPAAGTPGSVSARPRPSSGRVPTQGGKAAGPALREGPRGCQNFSYDNHLRVETRGLES